MLEPRVSYNHVTNLGTAPLGFWLVRFPEESQKRKVSGTENIHLAVAGLEASTDTHYGTQLFYSH